MAYSLITHALLPGGATGNTSSPIDTTGATLLVIVVADADGTSATITDSKSNTWTGLTAPSSGAGRGRIYYSKNPTVGTGHTFTTSGTTIVGAIMVFSGADTTSPFDVENGAIYTTETSAQPGSVTPANNGSLIIAGFGGANSNTGNSINAGFTITDAAALTPGVEYGVIGAYLIQGTLGAVNPTFSYTNLYGGGSGAVIAVFKPAAAAVIAARKLQLNQAVTRAAYW